MPYFTCILYIKILNEENESLNDFIVFKHVLVK